MLRDYAFRAVYSCDVRANVRAGARALPLCGRAFSRCVAARFLAVWRMSPYAGKKHHKGAIIQNFNLVCSECCAIRLKRFTRVRERQMMGSIARTDGTAVDGTPDGTADHAANARRRSVAANDLGLPSYARSPRFLGGSKRPPAGCHSMSQCAPLAERAMMNSRSDNRFRYLAVSGFTPPSGASPNSASATQAARSARRTTVDAT